VHRQKKDRAARDGRDLEPDDEIYAMLDCGAQEDETAVAQDK